MILGAKMELIDLLNTRWAFLLLVRKMGQQAARNGASIIDGFGDNFVMDWARLLIFWIMDVVNSSSRVSPRP